MVLFCLPSIGPGLHFFNWAPDVWKIVLNIVMLFYYRNCEISSQPNSQLPEPHSCWAEVASEIMSDSPDLSAFLGWMQATECMAVTCIGGATPFSRLFSGLGTYPVWLHPIALMPGPCFCLTSESAVADSLYKHRPTALCLMHECVFWFSVCIFCLCC